MHNNISTNVEYLLPLAIVLIATTLLVFRYETQESTFRIFPYVTFFTIYILVFYGLIPLGIDTWRYSNGIVYKVDHPFPHLISIDTYLVVVGYTGLHIVGFFAATNFFKKFMVHSIEVNAVTNRETKCLPLFALVTVFLSFVFEFSDGLGIPGTGQLVQPFWRCGFTILFWFLISGTLTKSLFVTFVFAVGTKFFLYLGTGLMTQALMDVMICIALLLYLGKIRWVILSSVLFLITLTGYNNIKCFHASSNAPTSLSGVVTSSCYTAKFETSAKSVARRSTHLNLLQHVIQSSWDSEFESPTRPFFRAVLNHIPRAI